MTTPRTNDRIVFGIAGWAVVGLAAGAPQWLTWLPALVVAGAITLFYVWLGLVLLVDKLDRLDERATRSGWDLWE